MKTHTKCLKCSQHYYDYLIDPDGVCIYCHMENGGDVA